MPHNLFNSLQSFSYGHNKSHQFYSLPSLEAAGVGPVSRLPVSIRIVLESVLRNCDGKRASEEDIRALANWGATADRIDEILALHTGKTKEEIHHDTERDRILGAQEAVTYGIVDRVMARRRL